MRRNAFKPIALLAVTLALAGAALAVSPSEAADQVKPLLGDAFTQVATLEQPLEHLDNRYYLFYFPVTSPNRIFLAVDELEGGLVTDPSLLAELAGRAYRLDVVRRVLKAQRFGYVDIDSFAKDAKRRLEATRGNYETVVRGQLENRYPSLAFRPVEQKLEIVELAATALEQQAAEGLAQERNFESSYNSLDLEAYLRTYNATLGTIGEYLTASDAYAKAVRDKANEALNSQTLTLQQKEEIRQALLQVSDVGAWEEYSRAYAPAREEYNRRQAGLNAWVNASIQAFQYEKAKLDAEELYKANEPQARELLGREFDLTACALEREFDAFKVAWVEIEALRQKRDLASYQGMLARLATLGDQMATLADKYNRCIGGATPTPAPRPGGPDTSTIAVALILIGAGAVAYWQYRKRQQEAQEEGAA
jgi:hypothetical protein